ncbi:MAG: hypothetical protein AMXMBFR37_18930 [Steroidobacteraceae bacterium]
MTPPDIPPTAAARATVTEPLGRRELDAPLSVGAPGCTIVVPDVTAAPALVIGMDEGLWRVSPAEGGGARLNGERLREPRDLRAGDVLQLADTQLIVRQLAPCEIEVVHLAGNDTIAPLAPPVERDAALDDEDVEIGALPREALAKPAGEVPAPDGRRRTRRIAIVAVLAAVVAVFALLAGMQRVPLLLDPAQARVDATDTWLDWHAGSTLFVLPGEHRVRASAPGYESLERALTVTREGLAPVRLRLAKQPGVLVIDTGGVPASVSVDGAQIGHAPGEVRVAAGKRTLTLHAERYLDAIVEVDVDGLGTRQDLAVELQPSWGTLALTVNTPGAQVAVDDGEPAALAPRVELPAGVHRVRITAQDARPWDSAIVIKAGETTTLGPIDLGAPDAGLVVRSVPSGADVSVDGVYRGRTPLTLAMAPGGQHDVLVARTGHAPWSGSFAAKAGERTVLDAKLEPVYVALTVRGEPADAELLVDGVSKGRTPLDLEVLAGEHTIEVRKAPLAPYSERITLAPGLARSVEYRLDTAGRPAAASAASAGARASTKIGYALRFVPPASFEMGSERREQGRRPNEVQRRVTLTRPWWIGETEVTNGQFRRFRPDHASGYVDKGSVDLDAQPVVRVSWDDAVEFCNWLSGQEGLPPAYEKKDGKWVLKTPVANGFRLPTEAEWEYAARYAAPGVVQRYSWGDALPIAPASGNYGGIEAQGTMNPVLESYRDDYPSVAPVGKFGANALGLYDMAGNVSEWVHDYYASLPASGPQTDPFGPPQGTRHAIRGSNWRTATVADLRLAWRDDAEDPGQTIGFRIARYAEP